MSSRETGHEGNAGRIASALERIADALEAQNKPRPIHMIDEKALRTLCGPCLRNDKRHEHVISDSGSRCDTCGLTEESNQANNEGIYSFHVVSP